MIDWSRVRDLRADIGAEDFEDVVELFLEEVQDGLSRIDAASGANLGAEMHALKGCALNLGFETFAALCNDAERRTGDGTESQIDRTAIHASFAETRVVFEANRGVELEN